jgi:hypothetical protein
MELLLPLLDVLLNLWLNSAGVAWLKCGRYEVRIIVNIRLKINVMVLVRSMKVWFVYRTTQLTWE